MEKLTPGNGSEKRTSRTPSPLDEEVPGSWDGFLYIHCGFVVDGLPDLDALGALHGSLTTSSYLAAAVGR